RLGFAVGHTWWHRPALGNLWARRAQRRSRDRQTRGPIVTTGRKTGAEPACGRTRSATPIGLPPAGRVNGFNRGWLPRPPPGPARRAGTGGSHDRGYPGQDDKRGRGRPLLAALAWPGPGRIVRGTNQRTGPI